MLAGLNVPSIRKTILQIFPSLFRDTKGEIFQAFCERILPKLMDILNTQDHSLLEHIFICLAFGLKYLYDDIKKDFDSFFQIYKTNLFYRTNKHVQK